VSWPPLLGREVFGDGWASPRRTPPPAQLLPQHYLCLLVWCKACHRGPLPSANHRASAPGSQHLRVQARAAITRCPHKTLAVAPRRPRFNVLLLVNLTHLSGGNRPLTGCPNQPCGGGSLTRMARSQRFVTRRGFLSLGAPSPPGETTAARWMVTTWDPEPLGSPTSMARSPLSLPPSSLQSVRVGMSKLYTGPLALWGDGNSIGTVLARMECSKAHSIMRGRLQCTKPMEPRTRAREHERSRKGCRDTNPQRQPQ
jgi:hypothetical protein